MPDTKNPDLRLRLLDECLQRRQKIWTPELLLATVAEKFWEAKGRKFSKSQFNLDIKVLREEYHAPLVYTRELGYHYTEPGFSILGSPLVEADADVLRQALALLRQFQGLGLSDELHELAQRVEGHLQAQPAAEMARQLISFEQVPAYARSGWGRCTRPCGRGRCWRCATGPSARPRPGRPWCSPIC